MRARKTLAIAALTACTAVPAFSQGTPSSFDRTVLPKAGANPAVRIPAWTKTKLSNGATLLVVERHTLPLVTLTMSFVGGANQFEPAG
jgi:zinc protease